MATELVSAGTSHGESTVDNSVWSVARWSEAIANNQVVKRNATHLSHEVALFEQSMDRPDRRSYLEAKFELEKTLSEVIAAQSHRTGKARSAWTRKLRDGWQSFCDTATYYQSIFDVLNNQAPEYSTAVWGAIKLLLLVSVNSSKLKSGVIESLDRIGHQLGNMKVLVELQPTKKMVDAVTLVYADTMAFLSEALRYYTENRMVGAIKKLLKPWEVRFKQLVDKIEADVQTVQELVQIGNAINTNKILEDTGNLMDGQSTLLQRQEIMYRTQVHNSEAHYKLLQKVTGAVQTLQGDAQQSLFNQIEQQLNEFILTVLENKHESRRPQLESSEETIDNATAQIYLSRHLYPQDGLDSFVTSVFTLLDIKGSALKKAIEEYSGIQGASRYATSYLAISEVTKWIDKDTSGLLFLESIQLPNAMSWSQDMCLEIIGALTPFEAVTGLYYLAAVQDRPSPELLVQNLIYQLICGHKDAFSTKVCRQYNITEQRFQQSASDIQELLNLFNDSLQAIRPLLLYIIIDSLEYVSIPMLETQSGMEKLECILDALKNICRDDNILCKVLVISASSEDKSYLETPFKDSWDPSRHKTIQIARGTHHDSMQNIAVKPIFRLPSQQEDILVTNRDPATLLDLDDHGLDHDEEQENTEAKLSATDKQFEWDYTIDGGGNAEGYLENNTDTDGYQDASEDQVIVPTRAGPCSRDHLEHPEDYLRASRGETPELPLSKESTPREQQQKHASTNQNNDDWDSDDSISELLNAIDVSKDREEAPVDQKHEPAGAEKYLEFDSD